MDLPSQFTFPSTIDGSVPPSIPDEESFKKQLKDYYNDMVRAQNAQQEELKEINYKLERALEEKSKMANEMKSMEAIRDAHVKQLASIQEEINALKGKTQSQTKEVERLMGNLAGKTDQLIKERAENEKLLKENNALKDYFLKAQNAFRNAKLRVVEVEKTNTTLKESYNRLHQEYIELRTQWLKENESRPRGGSDDVEKMVQELALAHTEINSLQEMLQAKTYELASYQDIESWFRKEEKENQALLELTKEIKEILSKRADKVDSKSVEAADELAEEVQEDKPTIEQLTQQLDGIVEEMKSQMTEVDIKLDSGDGARPNFRDPFHARGKEVETKLTEQSWKKPRQETVHLSSPALVIDEKLSPSSETNPNEVTASIYPPVSAAGKQSENEVELRKQEEEETGQSLPPAGFQLPSWLTCNKH